MVQCCTYNQSQYIEDALKGFAMQQTNFPFICCVFDDASTDGEQEVLKSWINSHCNLEHVEVYDHPLTMIHMAPDKENSNCFYAIHLQKVNTWGNPEKREMIAYWEKQCEYIALCEGDDYWIDPMKLQKQVDFLENHLEYGMVYTYADVLNVNGKMRSVKGRTFTVKELLFANYIMTLTVCIRIDLYLKFIDEIKPTQYNWKMGDYPIWLWIAFNSKIYCIPEYTAIYRILNESASHSLNINKIIDFEESAYDIRCLFINKYFVSERKTYIRKAFDIKVWAVFVSYFLCSSEKLGVSFYYKNFFAFSLKHQVLGFIMCHSRFFRHRIIKRWKIND